MSDDRYKDIVKEVFSKSTKVDERVSSLFAHLNNLPQVSPEQGDKDACDLKNPPSANNVGSPANKQFQSVEAEKHELLTKRTIKNKELTRKIKAFVVTGLVGIVFVVSFLAGSYLRQYVKVSTKVAQEKQYANLSESAGPLTKPPLLDLQPESASAKTITNETAESPTEPIQPVVHEAFKQPAPQIESQPAATPPKNAPADSEEFTSQWMKKASQENPVSARINKNGTPLDSQYVINWGRLLDRISATIPKTVQLSVLERGDGSQMFLEGRAFSADAIYDFVDALGINRQVKSAELTRTRIGKWESQDLLIFSISCCLVSDTKTLDIVVGDYNDSGFDKSRLFTPTEADKFFSGILSVLAQTDCKVKSFQVSPKETVFEDKKANVSITKKHAVLTFLGGYQNILKAAEKLQNRPQLVWFDYLSIREAGETEGLECSMGVSAYVADDTG